MKFKLSNNFSNVEIFSSEATDGPMNFNLPEGPQNIEKFLAKNKITSPLVTCSQPHKTKISIARRPDRILGADGLLTTSNFALGIKTADCIPLMIYNPKTGLIGAIHVSRNNLIDGIISISLASELKKLKIENRKMMAFLGPHIRVKNYPLKDESAVKIKSTKFAKYLINYNDRTHFDLTAAAISQLAEIGFLEENIEDSKIDVFSSQKFFSSRRIKEEDFGVFITVIFKDGKSDLQK